MSELEDEVPGCIICIPVRDIYGNESTNVSGSKIRVCAECFTEIWVAPTSFKLLEKYPATPLQCIKCGKEKIGDDPEATLMTAPGASEELELDPDTVHQLTQGVTKLLLKTFEEEELDEK